MIKGITDLLVTFFLLVCVIVASFFFGHEFGFEEGSRYQRQDQERALLAGSQRLKDCNEVITGPFTSVEGQDE